MLEEVLNRPRCYRIHAAFCNTNRGKKGVQRYHLFEMNLIYLRL